MRRLLWLVGLVLLAVPAQAQNPPDESAFVRDMAVRTGDLIKNNSFAFTDAVCSALAQKDPNWGRKVRQAGVWESRNSDAIAYRFGSDDNKALVDIVYNSTDPGGPPNPNAAPAWQVYPGPNTGNGFWMKCPLPTVRNARLDYTGDGKADILWRHATLGEIWLWPMDGARLTAERRVGTIADTNWEIRGKGDYTGDGKADILWRHKTRGALYLWAMSGSTLLSETYLGTVNPAFNIVESGDFNGDGKSDILWRHTTNGDLWMWLMNGPILLAEVKVGTVDPAFAVDGSADLNGDHKADIVWCRHGTGAEVWVWLMDGPKMLAEVWVGTVPDPSFDITGVADYTGDGKADILWRHRTRGDVWLVVMDGTTRLAETKVGTVADTDYRIVGNGDYNGDGRADILWHHATRGEILGLADGRSPDAGADLGRHHLECRLSSGNGWAEVDRRAKVAATRMARRAGVNVAASVPGRNPSGGQDRPFRGPYSWRRATMGSTEAARRAGKAAAIAAAMRTASDIAPNVSGSNGESP